MNSCTLILVTGLPCSGKTIFSEKLASRLRCPRIGKDEIKELMFDHIGFEDRVWSKKLGGASFELLYWAIEKLLATGNTFLVDVDFSRPDVASMRLRALVEKYGCRVLEIRLFAEGEVLYERFKERSLSGERHPGHVDRNNFEEFKPMLLQGQRERLDLACPLIEVDTTDFSNLDYDKVLASICAQMTSTRDPDGSLI
jgi:predicted kinase